MSRSKWKGFYTLKNINTKKKILKIWCREAIITSNLLNKKVYIHTGKIFRPTFITQAKIGFKFGEFAFTRKKVVKRTFNKKKKKK
jgi:small subunit ribosomal protein S19